MGLSVAALAACSETHAYPPAWPDRTAVVKTDCPRIAGTYANGGETSIHQGQSRAKVIVYLSHILLFEGYGAEYVNEENVARVRIDGPRERRLHVQFLDDRGNVTRNFVYSEAAGEYACTTEGLKRSSGATLRLFGSDAATIHLTTNAAGELIVKRTEAVWDLFPLPMYATYEDYVRFESAGR